MGEPFCFSQLEKNKWLKFKNCDPVLPWRIFMCSSALQLVVIVHRLTVNIFSSKSNQFASTAFTLQAVFNFSHERILPTNDCMTNESESYTFHCVYRLFLYLSSNTQALYFRIRSPGPAGWLTGLVARFNHVTQDFPAMTRCPCISLSKEHTTVNILIVHEPKLSLLQGKKQQEAISPRYKLIEMNIVC